MKYGWIKTNILDMWNRPEYNSERVNQLLFCDLVSIIKVKKSYCFIENKHGYKGWVDHRFVGNLTKKVWLNYYNSKKNIIAAKSARVYMDKGRTPSEPYELYYGTEFTISSRKDSYLQIKLPDGRRILSKSAHIKPIIVNKEKISGSLLVKEAKRFIGTPYLWGGISSIGFDCSGLVQTICRKFGVEVPRDTKEQIKAGNAVNPKDVKTGDLMFFNRHVGFAIGKDRLIHSSVGGNGVRINSLNKADDDYREDLAATLKAIRRIV